MELGPSITHLLAIKKSARERSTGSEAFPFSSCSMDSRLEIVLCKSDAIPHLLLDLHVLPLWALPLLTPP